MTTTDTIRVHVLLFSVLRDGVGERRLEMTLPTAATGTALLDALTDRYPVVDRYRGVTRLAVNEAYAAEGTVLADGDEVALITPVSGG